MKQRLAQLIDDHIGGNSPFKDEVNTLKASPEPFGRFIKARHSAVRQYRNLRDLYLHLEYCQIEQAELEAQTLDGFEAKKRDVRVKQKEAQIQDVSKAIAACEMRLAVFLDQCDEFEKALPRGALDNTYDAERRAKLAQKSGRTVRILKAIGLDGKQEAKPRKVSVDSDKIRTAIQNILEEKAAKRKSKK